MSAKFQYSFEVTNCKLQHYEIMSLAKSEQD